MLRLLNIQKLINVQRVISAERFSCGIKTKLTILLLLCCLPSQLQQEPMGDSDSDVIICSDSDDDKTLYEIKKKRLSSRRPHPVVVLNLNKTSKPIVNHLKATNDFASISTSHTYANYRSEKPSSSTSSKSVWESFPPRDDFDMNWTGDEELLDLDYDDSAPTTAALSKPSVSDSESDGEDVVEVVEQHRKSIPRAGKDVYDSKHSVSDKVPVSKTEQKKMETLERKAIKENERKNRLEMLEREKELKKAEGEALRNAKPGEAHKFITLVLDTDIPNLDALQAFLVKAEIKHELHSSPLYRNSVVFKRELVHQAMGNDLKLQKIGTWEEEDHIVIVLEPEDLIPNLFVQIHRDDGEAMDIDDMDAITLINMVKMSCPGKTVSLTIMGMEKYFKKLKTTSQKQFRDRVFNQDQAQKRKGRKNPELPIISSVEFQSAMVELQLETHVTYRLVNNVEHLGRLLTQYLKAVANAPFKRQRKEFGFDWLAAADSAGSVKVEADGKGLTELWIEQLKLFGKVGIEIAQALVKQYPTPTALLKKYDECETFDEALDLLRDITSWTGVGPLAKQKKVGPELSRKIYRFFTSKVPDRSLGSSENI